jgi:two-component system response regulator
MSRNRVTILIAEDSPADIKIMERAFQEVKLLHPIFFVRDGEEAIDFLLRRGPYANPDSSPRPDLILLDIRMPKASGIEVLRIIKNTPNFHRIPVTMLTTSAQSQDINECYDLGASSYVVKPLDFNGFKQAIEAYCSYWTSVVTLPNGEGFERG